MEQLNESQYSLALTLAENSNLKSRLVALHKQLNDETEIRIHTTAPVLLDSEIRVDNKTERNLDSNSEQDISSEHNDTVNDQKENSERIQPLYQNTLPCETVEDISPDPGIGVQDNRMNGHAALSIVPEIAMLSRPGVENVKSSRHAEHNAVIFPLKRVVAEATFQNVKTTSNIIKQDHIQRIQSIHESAQFLEGTSQNSVQNVEPDKEANIKADVIQSQHNEEPETWQEDDPDSHKDAQHAFDADEIDLEPAPAPKVVVRRNVKNYEEIQKEADTSNPTPAGHTIIS
jgi:hypothetical protein